MATSDVTRLGRFITTHAHGETVRAFVPPALPPRPPLRLEGMLTAISEADRALGRLDGISLLLPEQKLFLYMYIRKEAVLSSQIEGTQSSLSDLLRFETDAFIGQPIDDVREVSNYVDAMMHGLERQAELPLSLRLIREMHHKLLRDGRGASKDPGNFRTSQNWIGGTRPGNALFVPPPPVELMKCLDEFEKFMHANHGLPPLVMAGLLHVQFETIHPFLDGNGRLGRLLITLYLCAHGVLKQPLLYLSLFFKTHKQQYYNLLQGVRETGDWESWLSFFLRGVTETATQAFEMAGRILALFENDRAKIRHRGIRVAQMLDVHTQFQKQPFLQPKSIVQGTGSSHPVIYLILNDLVEIGILTEVTGRKRDRVYCYKPYLTILNEGAAP